MKYLPLFTGLLTPRTLRLVCNQNRWGSTLASVYSVRPTPLATVSAPVTWEEIEAGIEIEDFQLRNMPERLKKVGDLWAPLAAKRGRFDLTTLLGAVS